MKLRKKNEKLNSMGKKVSYQFSLYVFFLELLTSKDYVAKKKECREWQEVSKICIKYKLKSSELNNEIFLEKCYKWI